MTSSHVAIIFDMKFKISFLRVYFFILNSFYIVPFLLFKVIQWKEYCRSYSLVADCRQRCFAFYEIFSTNFRIQTKSLLRFKCDCLKYSKSNEKSKLLNISLKFFILAFTKVTCQNKISNSPYKICMRIQFFLQK